MPAFTSATAGAMLAELSIIQMMSTGRGVGSTTCVMLAHAASGWRATSGAPSLAWNGTSGPASSGAMCGGGDAQPVLKTTAADRTTRIFVVYPSTCWTLQRFVPEARSVGREWYARGMRFVVALVVALLALTGCSPRRVLALDEVEIVYSVHGVSSCSVKDVRSRLESFHVYADGISYDETDGTLHVLASRAVVGRVDSALTHRGDVALTRPDRSVLWKDHVRVRSADKSIVLHFPRDARRAVDGEPEVLVRPDWSPPLGSVEPRDLAAPVVLPVGQDITAYARARTLRLRLDTPRLPKLEHSRTTASPQPALGLARVFLPLAISMVWLVFVRRFDRARPEPWWLLLSTFATAMVLTFVAGAIEDLLSRSSPYLSTAVMMLDGTARSFPTQLLALLTNVGPVEESAKLLAVLLVARRRREFDEPVDGIIYAATAALGFAAAENIGYFALSDFSIGLVSARAMSAAPMHVLISSFWGYALGRKLVDPKVHVLLWFLLAVVVHALYDALLGSVGPLAYPLDVVLCVTFVLMLRRALRRGAVVKGDTPPRSERRVSVTVGSRGAFVAASATFVALEGVIAFARNATWHHGSFASLTVLVFTVLVVSCGAAVSWVTRTLPLDAVVDERGVTYAGDEVRWDDFASLTEYESGRDLSLSCSRGTDGRCVSVRNARTASTRSRRCSARTPHPNG